MRMIKKTSALVLGIAVVLGLSACGASTGTNEYSYYSSDSAYDTYYNGYDDYGYYEEEYIFEESSTDNTMSDADKVKDNSRKLIKTYNMDVETEEFDGFAETVQNKVAQLGGYIENLNSSNGSKYYGSYKTNRYSYMTIRIPEKNSDEFLEMIGANANITSKSLSVEDVTLSYVDIQSRKNAYQAEEKRLLELLEQAETIEDILTIEDRLTNIRYNVESLESQLRTYDNKVEYTTIYLNITEVEVYTEPEPESFGDKIAKSFTDGFDGTVEGLKSLVINIAGMIPGLAVFALFVLVVALAVAVFVRIVYVIVTKSNSKNKTVKTVSDKKAAKEDTVLETKDNTEE